MLNSLSEWIKNLIIYPFDDFLKVIRDTDDSRCGGRIRQTQTKRWHQSYSLGDRMEKEWLFIIAKGIICDKDMRYTHTHTHTHRIYHIKIHKVRNKRQIGKNTLVAVDFTSTRP